MTGPARSPLTAPPSHRGTGYQRVVNNPNPSAGITGRQIQFLRLAANGNTNAAIARLVGVDTETVNSLLRKVYRKLGAKDRAHAVAVAMKLGLIRDDEIRLPARITEQGRP